MRKVRDYIHLFEGYEMADEDLGRLRRGVCRVRLYQQPAEPVDEDGEQQCRDWQCPAPVALISELPDNPNVEVSEVIEVLAAELCAAHALPTATTTFIVHYQRTGAELARGIPETFALVEFSDRRMGLQEVEGGIRLAFGEPRFTHVPEDEMCGMVGSLEIADPQLVSGRDDLSEEVDADEV